MVQTWPWRRIRWVVVPVRLLIAAVIGGFPVYVRPQVDPLRHADAILVLGGVGFRRTHSASISACKAGCPS
jgi:hypothetical protein